MITTMQISTSVKKKKKVSSSNKQDRSNIAVAIKHHPKIELKKGELIQLLGRFEAELQAKDIALAALKSEKVRLLLSSVRLDRLNHQIDPYIALFRDSTYFQENRQNGKIIMKNTYETEFLQLIVQQKKQVETLKTTVEIAEKQCLSLSHKLQNEKKETVRSQTFQNQLLIAEQENSHLRNDLNNIQIHNKELEQQLVEIMKLLEHEHRRHKKFLILFLNNRKFENEHYKEEIKQLSNRLLADDTQSEAKLEELRLENNNNKQILTERIEQLQTEIDLLIKEKKQQSTTNHSPALNAEINESVSKPKSDIHQLPSNELAPSLNTEKISTTTPIVKSDVHYPTIIPTSLSTKSRITSPSISINTQQSPSTSSTVIVAKRNGISTRSVTSKNNSIENVYRIVKPTTTTTTTCSTKRANQTNFSSEYKTNDIRMLLETIHAVTENRLKSQTIIVDSSLLTNTNDTSTTSSSSSHSDIDLFQFVENGDADQLFKLLKLGCNPNSQRVDGNTCLHISTINGHIECIRYLLQFGANPYLENNLGKTSWHNLSQLDETIELECLHEFIDHGLNLPPVDLILDAVERNYVNTYDYLLALLHEQIKNNSSSLSRLLRTALRSTNTHFLQCLFTVITVEDFIQLIDPNTFISSECLTVLSSLEHEQTQSKFINLTVCISSSNDEHRFSYAIGVISITTNTSWLELERLCSKVFIDHITQIDSPFDYNKSSVGFSTNNIDTLTFGLTKWHYQDSPNGDIPLPYTIAQEQNKIIIHLKSIDINSIDSIAYNYFIPSQNLKTVIRCIEQHTYVGVNGAAYLQKKSLFEDVMRYLERPIASFSTCPKFQVIRFEFECVTNLDDCIDELVEQNFLRTNLWEEKNLEEHHSTKILLYFPNIQRSCGNDMINLLLNSDSVSDTCHKLSYTREDDPNSIITYYFPSNFHIFITLSKCIWSTENEIYKRFKWIPFKIECDPWNGMLKRHLWRQMIDINIRENRSNDHELIKTLQWVTNVWQRYNEYLPKPNLQDASLGPALFFDCPMEREAIFEWLQIKWNMIIAPLVREFSMNKYFQPKSKNSTMNISSLQRDNLENNTSYEVNACRTLYVLLQRAVSRDCPLIGLEREQYLLNFIGSRVEGSSSGSMTSSAASSRAGTPQLSGNGDFVSIQLE